MDFYMGVETMPWNLNLFMQYFNIKSAAAFNRFLAEITDGSSQRDDSAIRNYLTGARGTEDLIVMLDRAITTTKSREMDLWSFDKILSIYKIIRPAESKQYIESSSVDNDTKRRLVFELLRSAANEPTSVQSQYYKGKLSPDQVISIVKGSNRTVISKIDQGDENPHSEEKIPTSSSGTPNKSVGESFRTVAQEHFKKICHFGRYKGYFYSKGKKKITKIQNKLSSNDGKKMDLYSILYKYDQLNTHSVNLCGEGGSGKTFQILSCIEYILLNDTQYIPFYVPLSSMRYDDNLSDNLILTYILNKVGFEKKDDIIQGLTELGPCVIIFADGLNEVSDPKLRQRVAQDICEMRQAYKTRFLVSSRQIQTDLFNTLNYGENQRFIKAVVEDLTPEQVDAYFKEIKCSVRYKDISAETRPLLKTPQGCVMYAELVGSSLESNLEINSLGQLLESYCHIIFGVDSNNEYEMFAEILQEIGSYMVLNDTFIISKDDIKACIKDEAAERLLKAKSVRSIFAKNDTLSYSFTHQNFRDLFSGLKLAMCINSISEENFPKTFETIFARNRITVNDEILELTAAFVGENTIQSIIDILRNNADKLTGKFKNNYDFPLSRLVRIYSFMHNNNISDLNLSDLNLSEVCLNGFELFSRKEDKGVELSRSTINLNTLLKAGLPTGSSTICKYTFNNKEYLIAFDKTSELVIDIDDDQKFMVRHESKDNYGWVNIAFPTEVDGRVCILLGFDSGKIGAYYPDSMERELIFDTDMKSADGIQSLFVVKWNDNYWYAFCNTNGWLFMYNPSSREVEKVSVCSEEERQDVIETFKRFDKNYEFHKKGKIPLACRMDYDITNNCLIIVFGWKIYKVDLSRKMLQVEELSVDWKNQFPELIKDIKITPHYIFINEIHTISVLRNWSKCWEFTINQERTISRRKQLLKKKYALAEKDIDEIIEVEKMISTVYNGDKDSIDFYFQKFSSIPDSFYSGEEGVLVGIKTKNEALYNLIPQFFEVRIASSCRHIRNHNWLLPIRTSQHLATHSGVYYIPVDDKKTIHIATTSDDRSVDLIAPHSEETIPQHIEGAYNGVHDILIIDKENFVCAQYDGSLIWFSLKKFWDEDKCKWVKSWKATNVVKQHNDWVWSAIQFDEWNEAQQVVISCSYDETVRLIDFSSPEQSTLIIMGRDQQPIRGLCMTTINPKLYAFSYNYIFSALKSEADWEVDEPYFTGDKIISTIFDDGSGSPCVFYNTGPGSQGYIARYQHNDLSRIIIECQDNVFIRKAKKLERNSSKYLIIAGTRDNSSYIAIYKYNKETNKYDFLSPSYDIMVGNGVNDFDIIEINTNIYIITVSINGIVAICELNDDMSLTIRQEVFKTEDQPMCIATNTDYALIGLLNGKILKLSFEMCNDDSEDYRFILSNFITTHANLYSTYKVDISDAIVSESDSLNEQLGGYFIL